MPISCSGIRKLKSPKDIALKIALTGLNGGHSGVDIHLQRANANKLMFRFLKEAVSDYEVRLASVAVVLAQCHPREAFAVITLPADAKDEVLELVAGYENLFIAEYKGVGGKHLFQS